MTPALTALALLIQASDSAPAPGLDPLLRLRAGDEACTLFDAPHRTLLEAAIARARDDRVRAGADPAALDRATARIASGAAPACDDPDLAALAEDHRARVTALAAFSDLTFPGVHRDWIVDRRAARTGPGAEPRWRVSQRDGDGAAWFGVFEHQGELELAVAYNGEVRAARAGLTFRDRARQTYPLDFTAGELLTAPDGDPAASWGAGAGAQTRISASARLQDPIAASLAPAGGAPARGFTFPRQALVRLTALTPRDGVAVELLDPRGQVSRRIWFEVGALQAALAIQAAPRPDPRPVQDAASAP